jgi:small-conductance mechanosensitive channel
MKFWQFITPAKLIEIAVIVVIFLVLLLVINIILRRLRIILRDKYSKNTLSILNKLIIYGFILIYFLSVLSYFGVNLSGFIVAGGFLSIIIGLATQKVLGNMIAGIFLIIERPVKLGQSVTIGDVSGFVEEVRFLSTIIRSFEGQFIRIPNEQVFNSVIINLVENVARRIDYLLEIRYSDDFYKTKEVILNLLADEQFVLSLPQPEVFVEEFASSGVRVRVRFWSPTEKWYDTKTKLLPMIKKSLEENGIQIPFPQLEVKIKN